jgi:quinol monooxygenase YgiN
MYGLIVKLTAVAGRRDELIALLQESAADMPGCLIYVVAEDAMDKNVVWVSEAWDNMASHDASLSLPAVKNVLPRAQAIVANFEKTAVTNPVWGVGLPART